MYTVLSGQARGKVSKTSSATYFASLKCCRYPCNTLEEDGLIQLRMRQLVARWKLTAAAMARITTNSDSDPESNSSPQLRKDWQEMLSDEALTQGILQSNGKLASIAQ